MPGHDARCLRRITSLYRLDKLEMIFHAESLQHRLRYAVQHQLDHGPQLLPQLEQQLITRKPADCLVKMKFRINAGGHRDSLSLPQFGIRRSERGDSTPVIARP